MAKEKRKLANYYKDLPQGFAEDYRIDAKKTSVGVALNVIALVIAVIAIAVCWIAKFGFTFIGDIDNVAYWMLTMLLFIVGMILYFIAHELTHGLFYKLFTKQKLRFGLTLAVAYCGLKEGFVNKKTSLIATLAPLIIHSIWMIAAICLIPSKLWSWWVIAIFGLHLGGCCGDMWVAMLLIFKYRKKPVLVSDDGPCQIFYTYRGQPEASNAEQTEEVNGD